MKIGIPILCTLWLPVAASQVAGQEASLQLSQFEGTWVGLQSWTVDNPSAQQPQPVTLTLRWSDGRLTGSMTPFLGGADGVQITDAEIVGNELHLMADTSRSRNRWARSVTASFVFTQEAEELTGAGKLTMGDVPWLELDYTLSKKRSRY